MRNKQALAIQFMSMMELRKKFEAINSEVSNDHKVREVVFCYSAKGNNEALPLTQGSKLELQELFQEKLRECSRANELVHFNIYHATGTYESFYNELEFLFQHFQKLNRFFRTHDASFRSVEISLLPSGFFFHFNGLKTCRVMAPFRTNLKSILLGLPLKLKQKNKIIEIQYFMSKRYLAAKMTPEKESFVIKSKLEGPLFE